MLVLRSQALSLGILGALGVLGGLFCVLLVADLARAGILSATLCLVTRVIGARLLSFAGCGLRIGLIGASSSSTGVPPSATDSATSADSVGSVCAGSS